MEKNIFAKMHLIDVTNLEKKNKALKEMAAIKRAKYGSKKKVVLCVAGGDGTLMYLVDEAIELGSKIEEISLCILPFGTGNDLSRTMGWGFEPKIIWI
jgi:diacylglycerol kinase family enzyme